jgi:hypothetical protein
MIFVLGVIQPMAAVDRVDKFCVDGEALLEKKNVPRILAEVLNFKKWIQKHQSEMITPNSQAKLLTLVERYYLFSLTVQEDALKEAIFGLVADLLTLPEGKLISSKSKKKVLGWYDSLTASSTKGGSKQPVLQEWQVVDVSDSGKLTLMNPDCNEDILEDFELQPVDIATKIKDKFSEGSDIRLSINPNTKQVIKWFCDEEQQDN